MLKNVKVGRFSLRSTNSQAKRKLSKFIPNVDWSEVIMIKNRYFPNFGQIGERRTDECIRGSWSHIKLRGYVKAALLVKRRSCSYSKVRPVRGKLLDLFQHCSFCDLGMLLLLPEFMRTVRLNVYDACRLTDKFCAGSTFAQSTFVCASPPLP